MEEQQQQEGGQWIETWPCEEVFVLLDTQRVTPGSQVAAVWNAVVPHT